MGSSMSVSGLLEETAYFFNVKRIIGQAQATVDRWKKQQEKKKQRK